VCLADGIERFLVIEADHYPSEPAVVR